MDLYAIIFYLFAVITLGSATIVVFSKNVVYSAFALLFALFGVAGLYVLLMADFLAITQLLVYVGGILVLVLFGVMLTTKVFDVQMKTKTIQMVPAVAILGLLSGTIVGVFWSTDWYISENPIDVAKTAPQIGNMLLTTYLLPFEIASVVLLVALIGAAMIARRERKG
ncbi:MAG: NADH-quinone oxidoreductase subunit J [Ignavibacteria bacterium]|nr:NADH-quinone oxidoreductase subunit J [Ignavibacteria bacterium]